MKVSRSGRFRDGNGMLERDAGRGKSPHLMVVAVRSCAGRATNTSWRQESCTVATVKAGGFDQPLPGGPGKQSAPLMIALHRCLSGGGSLALRAPELGEGPGRRAEWFPPGC